jgi:hypothetical protein
MSLSNQTVTIDFTGSATDTVNSFTLLSVPDVTGPYSPATGALISSLGPGLFRATVPANGPRQFYRVQR